MKKSMLMGAIIFGVIVVGGIIVGVSLGNSNNDDMEIVTNTNNTTISNEKETDSFKMEKVQAGKYSFLVPDNGEKNMQMVILIKHFTQKMVKMEWCTIH